MPSLLVGTYVASVVLHKWCFGFCALNMCLISSMKQYMKCVWLINW